MSEMLHTYVVAWDSRIVVFSAAVCVAVSFLPFSHPMWPSARSPAHSPISASRGQGHRWCRLQARQDQVRAQEHRPRADRLQPDPEGATPRPRLGQVQAHRPPREEDARHPPPPHPGAGKFLLLLLFMMCFWRYLLCVRTDTSKDLVLIGVCHSLSFVQANKKTLRQIKKDRHFPLRKYAIKA